MVHSHFIPAFSTNLDISIMDEAHLRRAPLHIFLKNPDVEEVKEVFRRNLEQLQEDYEKDVLDRFSKVYKKLNEGGEGLQPSFAHARDVAQICQAVRINKDKNIIDIEVLEEALEKHVLIVLQRMKIDISQIANKTRSFRIKTLDVEAASQALSDFGSIVISTEQDSLIADLEENITPVVVADYLRKRGIDVKKIEVIAESEKELRRTILGW